MTQAVILCITRGSAVVPCIQQSLHTPPISSPALEWEVSAFDAVEGPKGPILLAPTQTCSVALGRYGRVRGKHAVCGNILVQQVGEALRRV